MTNIYKFHVTKDNQDLGTAFSPGIVIVDNTVDTQQLNQELLSFFQEHFDSSLKAENIEQIEGADEHYEDPDGGGGGAVKYEHWKEYMVVNSTMINM